MITKKDYIAPNIEMAGVELLQMVAASPSGITGGGIGWGGEDDGEHEADARSFIVLWDDEDEDNKSVVKSRRKSLWDDEK